MWDTCKKAARKLQPFAHIVCLAFFVIFLSKSPSSEKLTEQIIFLLHKTNIELSMLTGFEQQTPFHHSHLALPLCQDKIEISSHQIPSSSPALPYIKSLKPWLEFCSNLGNVCCSFIHIIQQSSTAHILSGKPMHGNNTNILAGPTYFWLLRLPWHPSCQRWQPCSYGCQHSEPQRSVIWHFVNICKKFQ